MTPQHDDPIERLEEEGPETPQAVEDGYALPPSAGLSRRGIFVDLISAWIGVALAIPLMGYLLEPLRRRRGEGQWVKIGPADSLRGGSRIEVDYSFTRQDAWLPSTTKRRVIVGGDPANSDSFTVFSSTCTHLGCGVRWQEDKKQFICPCHGGVFDAEGKPASGPVFRPLDRLQARVASDGQLEVLEA
jgi:menaquinol-cytochrome c reductase iron-sulfur subunit